LYREEYYAGEYFGISGVVICRFGFGRLYLISGRLVNNDETFNTKEVQCSLELR
jgi:hypothetical protein